MRSQSIHLRLDHGSEETLQTQLRKRLLAAIDAGAVVPQLPLPSCRKFAEQLGVSRNTVGLVSQQLVDDGHLDSRPKAGYFLSEGTITTRGRGCRANQTERRALGKTASAQALGIPADREAHRLATVRLPVYLRPVRYRDLPAFHLAGNG